LAVNRQSDSDSVSDFDMGLSAGFVATAMIIGFLLHRNFFCHLNCLKRTSFLGNNLKVSRVILYILSVNESSTGNLVIYLR
jgi:hypothetical protein